MYESKLVYDFVSILINNVALHRRVTVAQRFALLCRRKCTQISYGFEITRFKKNYYATIVRSGPCQYTII